MSLSKGLIWEEILCSRYVCLFTACVSVTELDKALSASGSDPEHKVVFLNLTISNALNCNGFIKFAVSSQLSHRQTEEEGLCSDR